MMCYATKTSQAALQDMVARYRKICEGRDEKTECEKQLVPTIVALNQAIALLVVLSTLIVISIATLLGAAIVVARLPGVGTAIALGLRTIAARLRPQLVIMNTQRLEMQAQVLRLEAILRETLPAI